MNVCTDFVQRPLDDGLFLGESFQEQGVDSMQSADLLGQLLEGSHGTEIDLSRVRSRK